MIEGMTVTSLSASLKNKANVARDYLWQIVYYQKISHIVNAKSR